SIASEIVRPRDLEGRTVAVNDVDSLIAMAVRAAVEADGGDPASIEFVTAPYDTMPHMLAQGHIDAAMVTEPFLSVAQEAGGRVVASPYLAFGSCTLTAVYFAMGDYAKAHPDLVRRFHAVIHAAAELA